MECKERLSMKVHTCIMISVFFAGAGMTLFGFVSIGLREDGATEPSRWQLIGIIVSVLLVAIGATVAAWGNKKDGEE